MQVSYSGQYRNLWVDDMGSIPSTCSRALIEVYTLKHWRILREEWSSDISLLPQTMTEAGYSFSAVFLTISGWRIIWENWKICGNNLGCKMMRHLYIVNTII